MRTNIFIISLSLILSFTSQQKYEPCIDRYPQCKMWKDQNMCNMITYKEYMMRTCSMSCTNCRNDQTSNSIADSEAVSRPPGNVGETQNNTFSNSQKILIDTTAKPEIDNAKGSHEYNSSDKLESYATALPQAMRLIHSLTQMISQTSVKKTDHTSLSDKGNGRAKTQDLGRKKNNLEVTAHKKGNYIIPLSRREEVEDIDDAGAIDINDNTIRMIIQNKKRSNVHKEKPHRKTAIKEKHNIKQVHSYSKVDKIPIKMPKKLTHKKDKTNQTQLLQYSDDAQQFAPNSQDDDEDEDEDTDSEISNNDHSSDTYKTSSTEQSSMPESLQESTNEPETISMAKTTAEPVPEASVEDQTTTISPQTTAIVQPSPPVSVPSSDANVDETTCEDCSARYSLILKQHYDSAYGDTSSSKFTILKGNVVQDIGYTMGSEAVISAVEFEEISAKTKGGSWTKIYFTIEGDLRKLDELENQVDKGNINGLLVMPSSLKKI